MNALEIVNLTKSYKKSNFYLDNINLTLQKGSIMGLVGKNGAGKSTIINSMFDIVSRDSGDIMFYGDELNDENKHLKNEIGVVFDTLCYSGEVTLTKLEKVLKDLYTSFDTKLFHQYADRFELPRNKKIKAFSRGMSMKLSIAVAISHGAKMLVLDEATAGLDPVMREEILDIFLDFVENEENSILISSHISSDLERIADYITFIDNGKIIFSESKDSLIYDYGIARMKEKDFATLAKGEYLAHRKRGLQIEVLVKEKNTFAREYPNIVVDNAKLDEILPIITNES